MTVRWGVLGAAWIADQAMAAAISAAAGAELVAVAARDGDRAREFAARHGIGRAYAGYDSLLADPAIDAVYVALANGAHLPWTLRALDAGKHVLCEKPLGLTAAEVETMAAAAGRCGRLLVEASWYRWHSRVRRAQEALSAGRIGAVRHVAAGFTFAGVPAGNYRLDPGCGGGALYDVGCYAISAALWAFGTPPRDVTAKARLGPTGVDLTSEVVLRFDGGDAEIRASIEEAPRQWLAISGERGEVELRNEAFTAWTSTAAELSVGAERTVLPPEDAYRVMVEEVSAVIGGGAGWVLPLADSLATARVIDAALASAASGAPVAL